jgi:SP family general alpha glucoside:H+ symporter-like MFS transporter
MMVRTIEIEGAETAHVSYKELWRGSDLRRTLICCFIYAAQNWAGNLIGNQAVFFFERESGRLATLTSPTDYI